MFFCRQLQTDVGSSRGQLIFYVFGIIAVASTSIRTSPLNNLLTWTKVLVGGVIKLMNLSRASLKACICEISVVYIPNLIMSSLVPHSSAKIFLLFKSTC